MSQATLEFTPRPVTELLAAVDLIRASTAAQLDRERQVRLGQFMIRASVVALLASKFGKQMGTTRLLDAEAGVGSLIAAFVAEVCNRKVRPERIVVTT